MSDDKELIEKAYQTIESAKTSGKIRKGINEVTKAVEKGTAKLVAFSGDINPPEIAMHLPLLCKEKNIPCIKVGGKEELGAAAGLTVSTSAVAVLNEGDAKDLLKEIQDDVAKAE
ncbi:ribosomal L7Ae/L30e/S12e/Gadd45 family protein [Nanoarchaeota archaeon]